MQDELTVVDSLTYNVAQLLRDTVGAYRNVEASVALGELAPELEGSGDAVLSGPVRLMHTNTGILVQGRLRAQMHVDCARCLEPVAVPLEVSVEEVFCPTIDMVTGKSITPEEEDRALWIDEHHILDLSEVLRQDVLLAAPNQRHVSNGLPWALPQLWAESQPGQMRLRAGTRPTLGSFA